MLSLTNVLQGGYSMKKAIALLMTILIVFSLSPGALRENVVKADSQPIWPMIGYNAQHTGQCQYDTANSAGTLKWKYRTGGQVISSPAIASDGTVYLGSYDSYFYAVNPDGTLRWRYQTGSAVFASPAIGADGTIYVGSEDAHFYALNPDGTLKWKYRAGDWVASPTIATDGTIYVGSRDHYLYALNPDGTLKWKYQTGEYAHGVAIASDGTVCVGSADGYLYALNPDGTLSWKYQAFASVGTLSIASDGTVYMGSGDHYLYALNSDGTLKWKYPTGDEIVSQPSVASDGTVYVGSCDHYLYALNPDGTLKWKYPTGDSIGSTSSIASDGTVYMGSVDHCLYALNPDGTLRWKYRTDNFVTSSPVITVNGTVYVGSADGYLYALGNLAITASADSGGSILPSGIIHSDRGDSKTFQIGPDVGYHIKDLMVDGQSVGAVASYTFTDVAADHTIRAAFEADAHTITASAGNGGSISPAGALIVGNGTDQVFAIVSDAGYRIGDVLIDGASVGAAASYCFANVTTDHAISVSFEPISYAITASSSPGGSIAPSGMITVSSGGSKTFSVSPSSGYVIKDVTVDGVSRGAISSYTFTNVTSNHAIQAAFEKEKSQTIIILQIGNPTCTVNGSSIALDSPPVIKNGRTLVPIRVIIEALGGTVGWDGAARKVTVALGNATIELWISKNAATVNGVDTLIDSTNLKVVPEIINGRTMLPLRFVSENLGCSVTWADATRTITITYQQ
ncbi:MAG: PQQ-binding-like beta-propeller repeat protein [Patescibacteria group bacterium]